MDALAGLLDGPRARQAFLLRSTLAAPWSLRIQDEAPLTLVAVLRGEAVIARDADDATPGGDREAPGREGDGAPRLRAGDVALVRGPTPYVVADDLATPVQAVIHPDQRCSAPDGGPLTGLRELGVRTWGNAPDGDHELLTGTYHLDGEASRRLLDALPPLLVVAREQVDQPLLSLLADEVVRDRPGQEAVLDRLLDVLLIAVVRAWFAGHADAAPGWYAAHGDPIVGPALRLLHHQPARRWTVASLAREVGVSRAALARRFHALVGEPPMAYLTSWRIALAADLLLDPGATIGSVAAEVGYGSPYALSSAFKRLRGISPKAHRERARGAFAA